MHHAIALTNHLMLILAILLLKGYKAVAKPENRHK
jgi:hypothetical protein